ncbi:hypothetical protein Daus18300_008602 [Diaporthe australafricana]|uniref:Uncharacterized protein n=1 Tax=Diaporthe australafricana TaxID=127596 RepID=A0ABR3WHJ1_9PEZI
MGSPHILYAIAKVNGRYRPLAALYRNHDNKGEYAVETCRRLLEIFEEPANRSLLLHELQNASRLPPEKWEAAPQYRNERPAFPFVATVLLLGASVEPETGGGYNAIHEPFNMPLATVPEGCTILDVTDPAAVRYAFAFILPQKEWHDSSIKTPFGNTPLTAWEYAAFYDRGFRDWSYLAEDDDAVAARAHAHLMETFRGQDDTKVTMVASPLIDEDTLENAWPSLGDQQSWRRRADLGLPEVMKPRPSPVNNPPQQSVPVAHHTETLYKAFEQSYRMFEPGYNEGLDTNTIPPVSPVKQVMNILYLGSLGKASWQARAAEYEPKSTRMGESDVRYFTFQVDDAPVTPGLTLDVLQGWMAAASTQEELPSGKKYGYLVDCITSTSDQNMLKFFGLAGPGHRIVKPLPGRAFYYAKASYHSSGDWTTVGLEEIKQGEWTTLLVQQWRRVISTQDLLMREIGPLGFQCAFVSRGADGAIVVADAEAFRSVTCSSPAYDALRALDPAEEAYGRRLADMLERGDGAIGGVPVSLMGRDEVLELLAAMDVVKAREEVRLTNSWSEVHQGIKLRRARERETEMAYRCV